jgi:SRSO17 transposase
MTPNQLQKLRGELTAFVAAVAGDFGRRGRARWGEAYLRGLLLDGDRKSIEPMADRLRAIDQKPEDYEQALQQFVGQSPWGERAVRDGLAKWVGERFGTDGLFILDDTGFPKCGDDSVGVSRQYSGTLGKVDNCQIGVTLQFVARETVVALDAALYLPRVWTDDRPRCAKAGVPTDVVFQTKWEQGLSMLRRAKAHGLTGIVLADAAYGDVTEFRTALVADGFEYVLGIGSALKVIAADADLGAVPPYAGVGRPPTRPAKVRPGAPSESVRDWASARADDFRTIAWRDGTKKKLTSRFAAWRVRPAHQLSAGREPLPALWLLVEWPAGADGPTKFFFAHLPADTSLRRLVTLAKSRYFVEHSYKELKDELGLDHFEGRSWQGWHHHVTLVLLAYAFLQHLRLKAGKKGAPNSRPCRPSVASSNAA